MGFLGREFDGCERVVLGVVGRGLRRKGGGQYPTSCVCSIFAPRHEVVVDQVITRKGWA